MTTAPLRGWFLDKILELDKFCPGFAGRVFRSSNEHRQVIAAYLASPLTAKLAACETGKFLAAARHCAILRAAYDHVPQGFRAALGRSGPQPFKRNYYRYLYALLSSKVRPETRVLIAQADALSPSVLRIARKLPTAIRRANLALNLKTEAQAKDLAALFGLFAAHGLSETEMARSLGRLDSWQQVRAFARRWSMRLMLPDHPVPSEDGYQPLRYARDLSAAARRFHNCMNGYLVEVLDGRSSFSIASHGDEAAVVHLRACAGGWMIDDMFGDNNEPPSQELERRTEAYLTKFGVTRAVPQLRHRKWAPLIRVAGQHAPVIFEP